MSSMTPYKSVIAHFLPPGQFFIHLFLQFMKFLQLGISNSFCCWIIFNIKKMLQYLINITKLEYQSSHNNLTNSFGANLPKMHIAPAPSNSSIIASFWIKWWLKSPMVLSLDVYLSRLWRWKSWNQMSQSIYKKRFVVDSQLKFKHELCSYTCKNNHFHNFLILSCHC